ncbi:MAG: DNA/RNA non-specific endonuclease [Gammaproteobacteria bacterium]
MTLAALVPLGAAAQEVAITHCVGSCPQYRSAVVANNSKVVIHHLYAAGLNSLSRRADWVAYRLTAEAVGVASLLPREWQQDRLARFADISELADLSELEPEEQLPDISTAASEYGGLPTPVVEEQNRVRLAPLTSFAKAPYWSELNNISNMLPMPAPLRLGAWLRLEQSLNALVRDKDQIHVITGPIYYYGKPPGSDILKPGVNLAGYFKIVSADSGTAAFIFPHDLRQTESYCDRQASIAEIEQLTNLDFFPDRRSARSADLSIELGCGQPVSP